MSVRKTSARLEQSHPLLASNVPEQLRTNATADAHAQAHVTFLRQAPTKTSPRPLKAPPSAHSTTNTNSPAGSMTDRTPSSLLELKQQRLVAAADRKKRLITRLITIVGLLIILLCAAIVALTLKMAPKIDELVRTKSGAHPFAHLISRMSTVIPPTLKWNTTSMENTTSATRRRTYWSHSSASNSLFASIAISFNDRKQTLLNRSVSHIPKILMWSIIYWFLLSLPYSIHPLTHMHPICIFKEPNGID